MGKHSNSELVSQCKFLCRPLPPLASCLHFVFSNNTPEPKTSWQKWKVLPPPPTTLLREWQENWREIPATKFQTHNSWSQTKWKRAKFDRSRNSSEKEIERGFAVLLASCWKETRTWHLFFRGFFFSSVGKMKRRRNLNFLALSRRASDGRKKMKTKVCRGSKISAFPPAWEEKQERALCSRFLGGGVILQFFSLKSNYIKIWNKTKPKKFLFTNYHFTPLEAKARTLSRVECHPSIWLTLEPLFLLLRHGKCECCIWSWWWKSNEKPLYRSSSWRRYWNNRKEGSWRWWSWWVEAIVYYPKDKQRNGKWDWDYNVIDLVWMVKMITFC